MTAEENVKPTPAVPLDQATFHIPPPDASEPVAPVTPLERDEVDRLDPQAVAEDAAGKPLTLDNGALFEIEPLKLRQFLRLLRIITRGASQSMESIDLDFDDTEKFVSGFLSLIVFALPEAEDEAVDFLQSIVRPPASALTGKADADEAVWENLFENLVNPSLDDTLTILQRVVEVEGDDLRALGKRIQKMFQTATAMGALDQNKDVKIP